MSTIKEMKVKALKGKKVMVETFDSAEEVVTASATRPITDGMFQDYRMRKDFDEDWHGVRTFEEAENLMKNGYQPTVDKMKGFMKNLDLSSVGKRIKFNNDVVGYAPVVPLALQGVPNCMRNSRMTPIKTKVLDVYYDMTASCGVNPDSILKAGQNLLGAIVELEAQGYKFNLYAVQSYYDSSNGADILCVKVKSSNTPLDLKRISFPLTHPAFFRVIGFDWYSRTPKGTYRSGYGRAIGYEYNESQINEAFAEIFKRKGVVFNCSKVLNDGIEHFTEAIKNAGK